MTGGERAPLGLLTPILPANVVAYDTSASAAVSELHALERASIDRAVPSRQREFATGRRCARRALAAIGMTGCAIPVGADREPCWPAGVVGSITHTDGYCAAAVARASSVAAVGIDAEVAQPLPDDVVPIVATPSERRHLQDLLAGIPDVPWTRLLFTAKEAVYKAWFPCARQWLDFDDVEVTFAPQQGLFTATLPGLPVTERLSLRHVTGRWTHNPRYVLAAVVIDRQKGDSA